MKILMYSIILLSSSAFATQIELEPGSTAEISASETTIVSCKGEQVRGSRCKLIEGSTGRVAIAYEGVRITNWKYPDHAQEVFNQLKEMRRTGECD
jgi:hypothetical protein